MIAANPEMKLPSGKTVAAWIAGVLRDAVYFETDACRAFLDDQGRQYVETCAPDDAEFWTVYGRDADGRAFETIDCRTRADAEAVMLLLGQAKLAAVFARKIEELGR